jgi:hypothetical protein
LTGAVNKVHIFQSREDRGKLSESGFMGLKDYQDKKMEEMGKLYYKYWGKARKKERGELKITDTDSKIFFGTETICHTGIV